MSKIAGYIIRAIEENYADIQRPYDPEEDENSKTSIPMLNKRISRQIVFYKECIKSGIQTERDGTCEMLKL